MRLFVNLSWTAVLTAGLVALVPASTAGGSWRAVDCPTRPEDGSGGPVGPGQRGPGAHVPAKRGPSSRSMLMIDWKNAISPSEPKRASPFARSRQESLSVAEALAVLTGEDRRPLLVLRECALCVGTEDALMSSKEDNERTYLLARWFHCVRLPPEVLGEDHAFRNLFPGEQPPHLFIANHDGSARQDLQGTHAQDELWAAMEGVIAASYKGSLGAALQRLERYLEVLDETDRQIAEIEQRYDSLVSKGGDLREITKLHADLDKRRKERDELMLSAARVSKLELRPLVPGPPAR